MAISKRKILRILRGTLWLLAGVACITLLVSSARKKTLKYCTGLEIEISGVTNNVFIDKSDVYAIVKRFGGDSSLKKPLEAIDLRRIEKELEKDVWIRNAELFFDNNDVLKIFVEEREPLARIFTQTGFSFYIDSNCTVLPLSRKLSARLPVFTGFTSDAKILAPADSALLCDIKNISTKIVADDFLMGMIDQVDINSYRHFEMIPKMGNQVIYFGDASDAGAKFERLKLFYKNIIPQTGWNRYSTLNLQYKDQVVAAIRGKEDVVADSLKTLAIMKMIAENAARGSADSLQNFVQDSYQNSADSSIVQQSLQRDEETDGSVDLPIPLLKLPLAAKDSPVTKLMSIPVVMPPILKPAAPLKVITPPVAAAVKQKPVIQKPATPPVKKLPAKPKAKPVAPQAKPKSKSPAVKVSTASPPAKPNDY